MNAVPHHISITGFTKLEQVHLMHSHCRVGDATSVLGVGVMTSFKIVEKLESSWAHIYPKPEEIADIFMSAEGLFNVLHYVDYDDQTSASSLDRVLHYAGRSADAIQFDMPWPKRVLLQSVRRRNMATILQIGRKTMATAGDNPWIVAERLEKDYDGVVSGILLDRSGGEGIAMDADTLLAYARQIKKRMPFVALGFAGGLGPDTMGPMIPVWQEFPDSFCDAQSKINIRKDPRLNVDWERAGKYLQEAVRIRHNISRAA